MVVPPKHPKMIIFSRKTHGCWVPPFLEITIWILDWLTVINKPPITWLPKDSPNIIQRLVGILAPILQRSWVGKLGGTVGYSKSFAWILEGLGEEFRDREIPKNEINLRKQLKLRQLQWAGSKLLIAGKYQECDVWMFELECKKTAKNQTSKIKDFIFTHFEALNYYPAKPITLKVPFHETRNLPALILQIPLQEVY